MRTHRIYMSANNGDGTWSHFTGCGRRIVGPYVQTGTPDCKSCETATRTAVR